FLQAEDGIRDRNVTGVQTCALPISTRGCERRRLSTSTCARGAFRAETSAPNALPAALSHSPAEISSRAESVNGEQSQPGLGNRRAGTHTLRPAIRISLTL